MHLGATVIKIRLDLEQSFDGRGQQTISAVGPLNFGKRKDGLNERIGDWN